MSEPIATERYRLALIAHHANELARLMGEQFYSTNEWWKQLMRSSEVDGYGLSELAKQINKYLNKEESK